MYEIKEINKIEFRKLMDSYDEKKLKYTYQKGLYYKFGEITEKYMAIDNTTNDAFTEVFDTLQECKNWLERVEVDG
jgi:hypothetical protein